MSAASRTYLRFVKSHPWLYIGGLLTMILTILSEVATPKIIQSVVDTLAVMAKEGPERHSPLTQLYIALLALGAVIILGFIGRFGWRHTLARATHLAGYDLKNRLWDVLKWQPVSIFNRYSVGNIMSRAISDWNSARYIHGFTLILTFDIIFFLTLGSIAMLMIDVYVASFALIVMPMLPFMLRKLSKKEGLLHIKAQNRLARLSEIIGQSLRTVRIQRATATHETWETMLAKRAKSYANANLKVYRTGDHIQPISAIPMLAAYAGIFILGIPRIESGDLSIGEFVALLSFVLMLQNPLVEIGIAITDWQTGLKSLSRLASIYDLGRPSNSRLPTSNTEVSSLCRIDLKDLNFSYSGSASKALSNINLAIEVSQTIGIYGPIGGGKSTLLKIIAGINAPTSGALLINNQETEALGDDFFVKHIMYIPHDPEIFSGTIRQNIALDDDEISDPLIWSALKTARFDEDVKAWKDGLDTTVGENGLTLSGGQKQRLSIARCATRKLPIVLLDDCLSAIDAANESEIVTNLSSWFKNATVVIVSHRPSSLKHCDRIFKMTDGLLVEESK